MKASFSNQLPRRLLLTASIIGLVSFAPVASQAQQLQTAGSINEQNPYLLRPIPGTRMPSLRGTVNSSEVTTSTGIFAQDPVDLAGGEIIAEEETVQAGPVPLSEVAQQRVTRQADVPAVYSNNEETTPEPIDQNTAVDPVEVNESVFIEDDPFAPTGFRLGTSIVNLRVNQSIGYSTNLDQTSEAEAGAFSLTEFIGSLVSDWSRHELRIDVDAAYRKAFNSDIEDRPEGNLSAALRLDILQGLTGTLDASYGYTTESLTSDSLGDAVSERPGIHTFGAGAELAKTGTALELSIRGSVDRTEYEEATLFSGGELDQADRNNDLYQATGRVGYNTGAVATPFLQAGVGWRRYDEEVDRNGERRNSMNYDLRAGLSFNNGEKLSGEISVGYLREEFDEGNFDTLDGFSVNSTLVWSPERSTTVALNASTALNPSSVAGDNGSIIYTAGLDITRQATDRMSLNFNTGTTFDVDDETDDTDVTWTVGVGAEYWMNRYMAFTMDLDYTHFEDGSDVDSYDDTTALIGIALQR